MQVAKLSPKTVTVSGTTTAIAKVKFPGMQKIVDFVSDNTVSSLNVTVDGDTDKEYIIYVKDAGTTTGIYQRLNGDSVNYGRQTILDTAGSITASRNTTNTIGFPLPYSGSMTHLFCLPDIVLGQQIHNDWTSGTTIGTFKYDSMSFNSTANVVTISFNAYSGNFATGTRIIIYARRSQT